MDLEEKVSEDLYKFTRQVIYGDKKSSTMAESRAAKWKMMKKNNFSVSCQMLIAFTNIVSVLTIWHT